MAEITIPIFADVSKYNDYNTVIAKQYDSNSRYLKVSITDDGYFIPIPMTSTVVINCRRADGIAKSYSGIIEEDGTITVPIHSEILQLAGNNECDISIIDDSDPNNIKKLTTTKFVIVVQEASYGGSDIENDPQYDVLTELILAIPKWKGSYNNTSEYNKGDIVEYSGSSYVATDAIPADITPTQSASWQVMARAGFDGDIVQERGESIIKVMSQKAVSDELERVDIALEDRYIKSDIDDKIGLVIDGKLDKTPNGTNDLIENNKITRSYLPDFIFGQLLYGGNVNITTMTALLSANAQSRLGTSASTITLTNDESDITGYSVNDGIFYVTTVGGVIDDISFNVGDWLISNGNLWTKVDNTDAVTGVKGNAEANYRLGNINLTPADIGSLSTEEFETIISLKQSKVDNGLQTQSKDVVQAINSLINKEVIVNGIGDLTQELSPNILYKFTEAFTSLTLSFGQSIVGEENEYKFQIQTYTTVPTINFPSGILWCNGTPMLEENSFYQFSILNNVGLYVGVSNE